MLVNLLFSVRFATGYIHSGEIKIFKIAVEGQLVQDIEWKQRTDGRTRPIFCLLRYNAVGGCTGTEHGSRNDC